MISFIWRTRPSARTGGRLAFGPALLIAASLLVAGCGASGEPVPSVPTATIGPGTTVSPAVNQTRAAEHLGQGRAATGSQVDRLQELGLIERCLLYTSPSPRD